MIGVPPLAACWLTLLKVLPGVSSTGGATAASHRESPPGLLTLDACLHFIIFTSCWFLLTRLFDDEAMPFHHVASVPKQTE